jgi:hypothetical protein
MVKGILLGILKQVISFFAVLGHTPLGFGPAITP